MITDVLSILTHSLVTNAVFPLCREVKVSSDLQGRYVLRFGEEVSLLVVDELMEELSRNFDDYELNEPPVRDGLLLTLNSSFVVVKKVRDVCVQKYHVKRTSILLMRVINSLPC